MNRGGGYHPNHRGGQRQAFQLPPTLSTAQLCLPTFESSSDLLFLPHPIPRGAWRLSPHSLRSQVPAEESAPSLQCGVSSHLISWDWALEPCFQGSSLSPRGSLEQGGHRGGHAQKKSIRVPDRAELRTLTTQTGRCLAEPVKIRRRPSNVKQL